MSFLLHADATFVYEESHQKAELLIEVLKQARQLLDPAQINLQTGKPIGEIYINFGDYFEQREHVSFFDNLFEEIKKINFQGICFEEFRGIGLLEDIYSATQTLREAFSPWAIQSIISYTWRQWVRRCSQFSSSCGWSKWRLVIFDSAVFSLFTWFIIGLSHQFNPLWKHSS